MRTHVSSRRLSRSPVVCALAALAVAAAVLEPEPLRPRPALAQSGETPTKVEFSPGYAVQGDGNGPYVDSACVASRVSNYLWLRTTRNGCVSRYVGVYLNNGNPRPAAATRMWSATRPSSSSTCAAGTP